MRNTWMIALSAAALLALGACGQTDHQTATSASSAPAVVTTAKAAAETKPVKVDGGLGDVIPTGLAAGHGGDWVIYGVPVHNKFNPGTTFGFVIAERDASGSVEKIGQDEAIFETGKELATGFHVPEIAATLDGGAEQPAYGYFVGSPAKITATVDGKTYEAKTAVWSNNAAVTVFWFDNTTVTGGKHMTGVTAFDASGKQIAQAPVYNYGE